MITSFLNIYANWWIFSLDCLSLPIFITTGELRQSAANVYKFFLKVAEKNKVYLSGLIYFKIDLT